MRSTNINTSIGIVAILSLLPSLSIGQTNDSLTPPPEIEIPAPKFNSNCQEIDLKWADTIIKEIDKICFVQLRPLCDDKKYRNDCYTESVINETLKFVPEKDSIFLSEVVIGFEESRMYKWKEVDRTDYSIIIESSLGKRESNILTMCYEPRHAIVFIDSSKDILGIYEICFECGNSKIAFNYVDSICMYQDDYQTLKKLFTKYNYLKPRNSGNK